MTSLILGDVFGPIALITVSVKVGSNRCWDGSFALLFAIVIGGRSFPFVIGGEFLFGW